MLTVSTRSPRRCVCGCWALGAGCWERGCVRGCRAGLSSSRQTVEGGRGRQRREWRETGLRDVRGCVFSSSFLLELWNLWSFTPGWPDEIKKPRRRVGLGDAVVRWSGGLTRGNMQGKMTSAPVVPRSCCWPGASGPLGEIDGRRHELREHRNSRPAATQALAKNSLRAALPNSWVRLAGAVDGWSVRHVTTRSAQR